MVKNVTLTYEECDGRRYETPNSAHHEEEIQRETEVIPGIRSEKRAKKKGGRYEENTYAFVTIENGGWMLSTAMANRGTVKRKRNITRIR